MLTRFLNRDRPFLPAQMPENIPAFEVNTLLTIGMTSLLYDNHDLCRLEFLFVGAGSEDRIRPVPCP
jgi:hypothetical protein